MFNKLIGDKKFYRMIFSIAVPIMIQNAISSFVNLLDNIMVGQLGTDPMSGVSIVNQLLFVFNLCIFGAISGPGIFSSQFFGKRDHDGIRYCHRYKLFISMIITAVAMTVLILFDTEFVSLYLKGEQVVGDVEVTLEHGRDYLRIMVIGLVPFALSQCYSGTLREMGETKIPMISGLIAVGTNLFLNWVLIYGKLGAPELGVEGAAIATVISRFVELGIVAGWAHTHSDTFIFVKGLYSTFKIPGTLIKRIAIKGTPLLFNELLWSAGMAILSQRYSLRGNDVIAAQNIASTISNLFNMVYMSFGTAISIVVGPMLGANRPEEAVDTSRKMIAFSVFVSVIVGSLLACTSSLFPMLYNTEEAVRSLASKFIIINGALAPVTGFVHASYFTIRSGGKTIVTFLFDSAFTWAVVIPVAVLLSGYTDIPIIPLFIICQGLDMIKCIAAFILMKKRIWLNNIVE